MKTVPLLLTVSLAANLALAGVVVSRPALRARLFSPAPPVASATPSPRAGAPATTKTTPPEIAEIDPTTWSRIATAGDPATTLARLKAEGFPPRLLRLLAEHLVSEQFAARWKALAAQHRDSWWQHSPYTAAVNPKLAELRRQLTREEREAITQLLGSDLPVDAEERARQLRQYGNLAPEKIARFEQIDRDYKDMMEDIRAQAGEFILPEDREKLTLLENEKRADIEKLLSPEEFFDYEIRSSVTARRLRDQLALFEPTEAEFRAMFTLQNAVEAKYGGGRIQNLTTAERRERNLALRALPAQMQSVLTPERFAAYELAIDPAYRQTREFVATQALPPTAAAQIVTVQKDTTARANALRQDRTLNAEQRNAQLASLAAETNAKLSATLGEKGLAAYRQGAGMWLNIVEPAVRAPVAPQP